MLKKILFPIFVFLCFIISMCESTKTLETEYNEKIKSEVLKSDLTNETILNFVLGSSQKEVSNNLKRLIRDGKLKFDENGNYFTENFFGDYTKATLNLNFYNDELLGIDFNIKFNDYNKNAYHYTQLFDQLITEFIEKYGTPDLDDRTNKLKYSVDWIKGRVFWIKNNREIILSRTDISEIVYSVKVEFIDKRIEKEQENDPVYQKERAEQVKKLIDNYNKKANEEIKNSSWDGSVYQVKNYLKNNLNDPKSFEAIEWSEVQKLSNGNYIVRCKYRAANIFGGLVISNQVFTLNSKGEVISIVDY